MSTARVIAPTRYVATQQGVSGLLQRHRSRIDHHPNSRTFARELLISTAYLVGEPGNPEDIAALAA
jgi:hypothetical protein